MTLGSVRSYCFMIFDESPPAIVNIPDRAACTVDFIIKFQKTQIHEIYHLTHFNYNSSKKFRKVRLSSGGKA